MTQETLESVRLAERVDELEERVNALEERGGPVGPFDRYDRFVLDALDDEDPDPLTLTRLYDEAGIVDREKRKRRARRLSRLKGWRA